MIFVVLARACLFDVTLSVARGEVSASGQSTLFNSDVTFVLFYSPSQHLILLEIVYFERCGVFKRRKAANRAILLGGVGL